jgi:hypothetical protein
MGELFLKNSGDLPTAKLRADVDLGSASDGDDT